MKNVEATQALFAIINGRKEDLSKLMAKSKRVGFDADSEARRKEQITATADEISNLFRKCERNIQARTNARTVELYIIGLCEFVRFD